MPSSPPIVKSDIRKFRMYKILDSRFAPLFCTANCQFANREIALQQRWLAIKRVDSEKDGLSRSLFIHLIDRDPFLTALAPPKFM